jgi:hypothetical protein
MKFSLMVAGLAAARLFTATKDAPAGTDGTGAYTSFSAACEGCKEAASASCTKYLTSVCYAGNVHALDLIGNDDNSDKHEWHWSENSADAGPNYKMCFANADNKSYIDNFGDKYDPNDSKYVDCTAKMAR